MDKTYKVRNYELVLVEYEFTGVFVDEDEIEGDEPTAEELWEAVYISGNFEDVNPTGRTDSPVMGNEFVEDNLQWEVEEEEDK